MMMNENENNDNYGTLSEAINKLIKLGYTHDFNIKDDSALSVRNNITLSPDDFQIDRVFRFEGDTDPDYQSILYAISSEKFNVKGILVNGYGISFDEESSKLVEKLKTNEGTLDDNSKKMTPLRPDGERIVSPPLAEINLIDCMKQLISEPTWENSATNSITIFKSETMRIVLIGMHENAELKPHKANGVISVQVLSGILEFTTDQYSNQITIGQLITLKENITHSVKSLTECFFLLTLALNK